jgi:hypothetical protein
MNTCIYTCMNKHTCVCIHDGIERGIVIIDDIISFDYRQYECYENSQRGINVDHGTNVDQHSRSRNKCKYSILHLRLFRGFEC